MFKMLIVEDEFTDRKLIEEHIKKVLNSPRSYSLTIVETQKDAIDIIKNQRFDFAFVDSRLPCDDPQDEEWRDDAGKEVLEEIYCNYPDTRLFLISKYYGSHQAVLEIDDILRNLYPYIEITKISKTNLVGDDAYVMFRNKFKQQYVKWLKQFIKKISVQNKLKIKNAILAQGTLPAIEFKSEKWEPHHYFVDVLITKKELLDIISPNIMLITSESIGVDGVKRATHDNINYFIGSESWYCNMINQLDNLLDELTNLADSLSNEFSDQDMNTINIYLDNVHKFKNNVIEIGENEDKIAIEKRKKMRDKLFRFGTAPDAQAIKIGTHLLQSNNKIGGNEIEIYFPVHTLYEKDFSILIDKCDDLKCHSFKTHETKVNPITWGEGKQYQPTLFKEYFIFEQFGEDDYSSDIPSERLPDYLQKFVDKRFDYFGTLYVILRRGNSQKIYDCTYRRLYDEKDIDIFNDNKVFIKYLNDLIKKKIKALFVFEFLGWRQI